MEIQYQKTITLLDPQHQDEWQEPIYENISLIQLMQLQRSVKKNKKITIDLTNTKYDVIFQIAENEFQWNILEEGQKEECNIIWTDTYINEEWLRKMLPFQKINHFPGSQCLGKKNFLSKHLSQIKKVYKDEYDFYPQSWLLPYQYEELKLFSENQSRKKKENTMIDKPVFIVKPEASCQGKGIFLTKKIENSISPGEHYVVQEYIKNPLIIDSLKFDFRLYVLVKSVQPLKIFLYREGLSRFATSPYEKPSKKNLSNLQMHLTNYAVNKKNKGFIYNKSEQNDNIGHKRSFSAILNYLEEHFSQQSVNQVMFKIRQLICKTVCSVQPYLNHLYKSSQAKEENNEMCFEILGFDIMLDSNLKPWLLEVNHTPSFQCDTPLDKQIKKNLLTDTLILVNIKSKAKTQYYESKQKINYLKGQSKRLNSNDVQLLQQKIERYEDKNLNGYMKIHPSTEDNFDYTNLLIQSKIVIDEFFGLNKKQPKVEVKLSLPPKPQVRIKSTKQRPTSSVVSQQKVLKEQGEESLNNSFLQSTQQDFIEKNKDMNKYLKGKNQNERQNQSQHTTNQQQNIEKAIQSVQQFQFQDQYQFIQPNFEPLLTEKYNQQHQNNEFQQNVLSKNILYAPLANQYLSTNNIQNRPQEIPLVQSLPQTSHQAQSTKNKIIQRVENLEDQDQQNQSNRFYQGYQGRLFTSPSEELEQQVDDDINNLQKKCQNYLKQPKNSQYAQQLTDFQDLIPNQAARNNQISDNETFNFQKTSRKAQQVIIRNNKKITFKQQNYSTFGKKILTNIPILLNQHHNRSNSTQKLQEKQIIESCYKDNQKNSVRPISGNTAGMINYNQVSYMNNKNNSKFKYKHFQTQNNQLIQTQLPSKKQSNQQISLKALLNLRENEEQ